MRTPRRVAAVSYLNTVPFIYGIEHAENLHASLVLSPPSRCAAIYAEGKADIALVPAGALKSIGPAEIITSYCIGASRPVRTVTLMSNVPVESIRRIYLDSHSITSSLLVRILAGNYWNIVPLWNHLSDYGVVDHPHENDGFLLIGDKVFDYESRFDYIQDLSVAWNDMTGLPFAFAVWISRPGTDPKLINELNSALSYGISHIPEAIAHYGHSGKTYSLEYLTKNIDYNLDQDKRKAISLYHDMAEDLPPILNPG